MLASAGTRAQLLHHAEELVRTRGYAGFSYGALSERAGLRKASIHHHFPAKLDLALALLAAYDARYDAMMDAIGDEPVDAFGRLGAYAALYGQGIEKGLGCLCAAFATEFDVLPEPLRAALSAFFAKHVSWVEDVLAAGHRDGSIRRSVQPAAYARLIVAALEGALMMERALEGTAGFAATMLAFQDALRQAA